MIQAGIVFGSSLGLALVLTPLIRKWAIRYGYVAQPKADRWHQKPTALMGGPGILLAYMIPLSFFLPNQPGLWVLLVGSLLIFGVGLVDDLLHLKPYTKLIGQIVAACMVMANGILLGPSSYPIIGIILTLFWIVGMTNAFNLLDNMDGLSAGTACIAGFCLFFAGILTGSTVMILVTAGLCGATLGFLWFNFFPAKIFMGDSGSLFLGFTLSTVVLTGQWEHITNLFLALLIPVLVLAVPIFDTTFVSLLRFFNGQAISQGGRDHTSHRLVAFGLPERTTVLLFYVMSMICGMVAVMALRFDWYYPAILAILIIIVLWYFGVFLSGVLAYGEKAKGIAEQSHGVILKLVLMEKKRIGEVFVDSLVIVIAFTVAYAIRFDGLSDFYLEVIARALPILLPLKLAVFFYFGLYRGLWRYVGIQDLLNIVKAVTVSSLLAVVVMTMVFRFEGHSRSVFFIDWMLLLLGTSGVRLLVPAIRESLIPFSQRSGKRLLIMGAGDAGEIALREIKNNATLGYLPIGFVDDDRHKRGRKIHGVPILGTRQDLPRFVKEYHIEEILVAIPSADRDSLRHILKDCKNTGVMVQIMNHSRKFATPVTA